MKGASTYSWRLYRLLEATVIPLDQPLGKLMAGIFKSDAHIYHIQYEYSSLGNPFLTVILLPLIMFLLRLRGKRTIVTFHGVATYEGISSIKLWYLKISCVISVGYKLSNRVMCGLASKVIVHTELMKKALISCGASAEKVVVIPHGSETHVHLGTPKGERVLFWGFIRPSKGLEDLLSAMKILETTRPQASLIIAGTPKERGYVNQLKGLVDKLGLRNVSFLERFLTDEEVKKLMTKARVVALPYTDRFLEVSGVLHFLATFGRPVVCSKTPRFTAELEDGLDCLMYEPGDVESLSENAAKLLSDDKLAFKLGRNLRQKFLNTSWDNVASMHLKLYKSIDEGVER
jgi:glycosyltransferase involved in cell wall biosynthesis